MRMFNTGATRNTDTDKFDYEGFLSPFVLEKFGEYMHKNRKQADGNLRSSDNWQKGIPRDQYMKSLLRHVLSAWRAHRKGQFNLDEWMAMWFNVQGYVLEQLIADGELEASIRPCEKGNAPKDPPLRDNYSGSISVRCQEAGSDQSWNLEKRNLLEPDSVRVPSVPV